MRGPGSNKYKLQFDIFKTTLFLFMSLEYSHKVPAAEGAYVWVWIDAFHTSAIPNKLATGSTLYPFNLAFGTLGSCVRYCAHVAKQGGKAMTAKQKKRFVQVLSTLTNTPEEGIDELLANAPGPNARTTAFEKHDRSVVSLHSDFVLATEKHSYEEADKKRRAKNAHKVPEPLDELTVYPADTAVDVQAVPYDRRFWPKAILDSVGADFCGRIEPGPVNATKGERVLIWENPQAGFRSQNERPLEANDKIPPYGAFVGNVAALYVGAVKPKPKPVAAPAKAKAKEPKRKASPGSSSGKKKKAKAQQAPMETD